MAIPYFRSLAVGSAYITQHTPFWSALETMPMREDNHSRELSPARRRQEVAAIMAAGVLRHSRMARKATTHAATESCDSLRNPLGPIRETRPLRPPGYEPDRSRVRIDPSGQAAKVVAIHVTHAVIRSNVPATSSRGFGLYGKVHHVHCIQ